MPSSLVNEFYERGYALVPDVYSSFDVKKILAYTDILEQEANQLAKQGKSDKVMHKGSEFVLGVQTSEPKAVAIKRVVWAGACVPELVHFGRSPKLLQIVADILGVAEADHLINQVHFKHPGDGVSFPLHQDSTHRRYGTELWEDVDGKGSYVQCLLALDEITEVNGPLLVIPGSGVGGHLGLTGEEDKAELLARLQSDEPIPVLMKPGSVLFFGPYLIHGSKPNESSSSRRVFINGFAYPGANRREYPGDGSGKRISLVGNTRE